MEVNTYIVNGVPVAIPDTTRKPKTTKFLLNIAKALSEGSVTMESLAKDPVTIQDLLDSAVVTPL